MIRKPYLTSFGLISLCVITVFYWLILKASLHCAWDLPPCCLQSRVTPFPPLATPLCPGVPTAAARQCLSRHSRQAWPALGCACTPVQACLCPCAVSLLILTRRNQLQDAQRQQYRVRRQREQHINKLFLTRISVLLIQYEKFVTVNW